MADIIVHRGATAVPSKDFTPEFFERIVGRTWRDDGYFSTSYGPSAVFSGAIVFHIRLRAGVQAISVDDATQSIGEREILIRRHTAYFVHRVERRPDGHGGAETHVYLETLPAEWQDYGAQPR